MVIFPYPTHKAWISAFKNKEFPVDCKHRSFFGCNNPKKCIGCYYNPIKEMACAPSTIDDEPKNIWFYEDKKHSIKMLKLLENMKAGKGKMKNGTRVRFKYQRNS